MKSMMTKLLMLAFLGVAACSTMPESVSELERARQQVEALDREPMVEQVASDELAEAKAALARAERAFDAGRDVELVRHDAYLASRYAEIGQEQIAEAEARDAIAKSEQKRQDIQLRARELETRRAQSDARNYELEADRQAAEAAEQRRLAELQRSRANSAARAARELAEDLQEAEADLKSMETELENIKTENTERGLVLTLTDVLFDTGEADLKPGADKAIDYLADFLDKRPERMLLIEGHTDSRGSDEYNRDLSKRRANAVLDALVAKGVDANRVKTVGHGEDYPVATNDTMAGRQQNRRVEIVITDADEIDSAVQRDTTANNSSQ